MDQEKKSIAFEIFSGVGPVFWVSLVFLIVFSYGAAKLNWTINRSYAWSFLAFVFSAFYYPYYAFFQAPSVVGLIGGRR